MNATVLSKPDWLIVGDGALLDGIPFSALPIRFDSPRQTLLAEAHDLRFLPTSALLCTDAEPKPKPAFLGVGDPIYNLADPRWTRTGAKISANNGSSSLSRLAASAREVRAAARQSGLSESKLLLGSDATGKRLQAAIATPPEILHFAVHVVEANPVLPGSPGQSSQAALALSMTPDAMPELLTPEAIATLRVPGTLVILSGCSSQKGDVLPSAGLMGLSRAWLLAGASAVVVSAWPTPDDSGQFFSSFYGHLKAQPSGGVAQRAALALQATQAEMQHAPGYRSSPRFWAAYSIISKE
jgi:CHAT domain-containing protein